MAILNYSTAIPPERTVAEIVGMLVRKGARSVTQDYLEDGRVKAIHFIMVIGGLPTRFLLPVNIDGVAGAMLKEKPYNSARTRGGVNAYKSKIRERAEWISWRILKDWVAAQMALIESGQADAGQVFLPYVVERNGKTIYELFLESNQQKALGDGSEEEDDVHESGRV
jgi:hypothetical protein